MICNQLPIFERLSLYKFAPLLVFLQYIHLKKVSIVLSFYVKDNDIFPC